VVVVEGVSVVEEEEEEEGDGKEVVVMEGEWEETLGGGLGTSETGMIETGMIAVEMVVRIGVMTGIVTTEEMEEIVMTGGINRERIGNERMTIPRTKIVFGKTETEIEIINEGG
jgi:hypothetical protein